MYRENIIRKLNKETFISEKNLIDDSNPNQVKALKELLKKDLIESDNDEYPSYKLYDVIIREFVKDCKLVERGSRPNGHDCCGNSESTDYKYVWIDNKKVECWDEWIVIHDKINVKEVTTQFILDSRDREEAHFKLTGFGTPKEFEAYKKGLEKGRLEKDIKI